MPLDIEITYDDGSKSLVYIPLSIMRGEKNINNYDDFTVKKDWEWVNTEYNLELKYSDKKIIQVQIDPSTKLADIDKSNNYLEIEN